MHPISHTHKIRRFLLGEGGPTAVEYAVMLAMIVIVCIAAVAAVGTQTNALFQKANNNLRS